MSNVRNERLYNIWTCMKMRCLNKNNPRYHRYGGRGIRVADCWLHDYQSFKKWALSNGYGEGMSIERIDNDGNYCPENCKWIPQSQQSKNRTMNIAVSYRGETMCLSDMCRKYDVYNHYGTIRDRILKKHMSFEEAINTPVKSIHDNDITGKRYGRLTVLHFLTLLQKVLLLVMQMRLWYDKRDKKRLFRKSSLLRMLKKGTRQN